MKSGILFLLLVLLGAGSSLAESRYVSDELILPLRQGQSEKHKILKLLKAGTVVEVLEETDDYALVRASDGTEGYVAKRFLTTETPKAAIIARLEKDKTRLEERVRELEATQSEIKTQADTARQSQAEGAGTLAEREKELEELRRQYQDLQQKSQGVIQLSAERDRLQAQNGQLTAEVKTLREKSDKVLYTGAVKWFLAGGGVLLAGWIMGRSSKRKKGYF